MKKVVHTICIFLSLAFAFVAVTFCWFSRGELLNFRNDFGSAKASYFGGGDGSREKPYEISSETHFYNFAWLQYLGYFNHAEANNGRYQSYFRLADNIDMIKLNSALPPIGTSKYPFIGNFDGCGYTVKNVTISNKLNGSDGEALTNYLNVRPTVADNFAANKTVLPVWGDTTKDVNIVGLFGITGDYGSTATAGGVVQEAYGIYSESNTAGKLRDTLKNPAASIEDKDANDPEKAYYGAMSVANFYADNLHVRSASDSTLVGLAAGYANAAIGSVGVYRCDITVKAGATGLSDSAPLSNYSLLGDFNSAAVSWKEKPGSGGAGDDAAWGGSIDMRTLSRRLSYMYANGTITGNSVYYSKSEAYKIYLSNSEYSGNANYDWQENKDIYMHVMDGTIIPVNVNTTAMGIDSFDNVLEITAQTANGTVFKSTQEYINNRNSGEVVSKSNTGYFVGAGTSRYGNDSNSSKIRAGIRGWNSGTYYGVYKSFKGGKTTREGADPITYTTSGNDATNKIFAFFTLQRSGSEWTTYRIVDDVNESNYTAGEAYDGYTNKKVDDLNFTEYKIVRKNFDAAMNGSKTLHGFHFMNYLPEKKLNATSVSNYVTRSDVSILGREMKNYQLVKGALNFTVEKQGKIAVVLGAGYNNTSAHSLFDLYQVTRDSNNHSVMGLTRIEAIYTKENGGQTEIAYKTADSQPGDDYSLAIDIKSLSSKENNLRLSAAYYFEMPVSAGDYAIGMASNSSTANAYLMYLDIGANGGGNTGEQDTASYDISTLDFVSKESTGYAGTIASGVTEAQKTTYKDVSFAVSANGSGGADGSDTYVKFERENKYSDGSEVASGDKDVATKVLFYYWNMTVEPTPKDDSLSSGTEKKKNAA